MKNSMLTIVKRKDTKVVRFNELQVGEVFKSANPSFDNIFMKIEKLEVPDSSMLLKNAIDLKDGYPYFFAVDDKVFRVNATLMED